MSRRNRAVVRRSRTPWVIAALAGLAVIVVVAVGRQGAGHVHPEPRVDEDLAVSVMPAGFFANDPRVHHAYAVAREAAVVLDGIYCFCQCHETIGHRSLYQCFQSQHGAGCDICINQAELAYRMNSEGRTLNEIRAAMDATWGP